MIAMIMNNLTIVILIVIQRSREHSTTFETERRNKRSLDGQPPRARFQHKGDWAEIKADDDDNDDDEDMFFSNSKPFRPFFLSFAPRQKSISPETRPRGRLSPKHFLPSVTMIVEQ